MSERVLVVGAGAIGGVTAAHLAVAGHEVVVLDADAEHVARLRSPGLLVEELDEREAVVPLTAATNADDLRGSFDFALLTLKSTALASALAALTKRNLVDTYVSLGNGLVHGVIERSVGPEHLLIGVVEWGATNLGPGRVRQTTRAPFVVGEPGGMTSARVRRLCRVLNDVATGTRVSPDIRGQVWSKLLVNSVFSGLGAVGGCLYRDIAANPIGRDLAFRMWTEGYDVGIAQGLRLDEVWGLDPTQLVVRNGDDRRSAEDALDLLMSRAGPTKASMLQDLERGLATEVDVINGGVVAAADSIGVHAPLNAEVVRIVHECERGLATPDRFNFGRLAAVAVG